LGTKNEYTIYEAEAVGLTLAAELIATEKDISFLITIFINKQAMIQSSESFYLKLGLYLINHFCHRLKQVVRMHHNFNITLQWLPGHVDIHRNKEVDR
ncbi:hypothetical protein EDD22DRAFT_775486, partial [Suillus occidentalis]